MSKLVPHTTSSLSTHGALSFPTKTISKAVSSPIFWEKHIQFVSMLKSFVFVLSSDLLFCFLVVLGLELRAYTLCHSTSPFFGMFYFEIESH
jgi:hypothetical protein